MRNQSKLLLLIIGALFISGCDSLTGPPSGMKEETTFETDLTLESGQTGTGYLKEGATHEWTFTAEAGDFIAVSVGDADGADGELTPGFALIAPSGEQLGGEHGFNGESIWKNATETGTYTITIHDYEDNDSGNYTVSLVLSGGELNISEGDIGGAIVPGTTVSGALSLGENDGWTFNADAGDFIAVSVGDADGADGALTPGFALIAPSGEQLGGEHGFNGESIWKNATETGIYTIIVHDYEDNDAGNYTVSLTLSGEALTISEGDDGGAIVPGTTVKGALSLGENDGWTFNADAGSFIAVSVGDADGADGALTPGFALIAPSGEQLGGEHGFNGESIWKNATETGIYTIIVHDYEDNDAGNYTVSLAVSGQDMTISDGDEGGAISSTHAKVTGKITLGELDGWYFSGIAGTEIQIIVTDEDGGSGALTPGVALIDPNGKQLKGDHGFTSVSLSSNLTESGKYMILVHDYEDNDEGNYSISLSLI